MATRDSEFTFTTSAPMSPKMRVANGPASTWVKSSTRTPSSGRPLGGVARGLAAGAWRGAKPSAVPLAPMRHGVALKW